MLRFLSFGSGSSGNSYLLESPEASLLVDTGVGYRKMKKYFAEYSVNREKIKAILLTHDHTDHVAAVSGMSRYLNIPVYATDIVHQRVRTNYRIHEKLPRHMVAVMEKYTPVVLAGFTVEAFDVPHDSADCCGYSICHSGRKFVLVTDCGKITDEVRRRALEAHYLVVESNYDAGMLESGSYPYFLRQRISGSGVGHLSNHETAQLLAAGGFSNLRAVFLCHLSENNNTRELAANAASEALAGKGVALHVLERRKVSGIFELR